MSVETDTTQTAPYRYDPEKGFYTLMPRDVVTGKENTVHDRMEILLAVRKRIDEFPVTKSTFKACELYEETEHGSELPSFGLSEILQFAGSWPLPGRWTGGPTSNRQQRYVNPNAPDAYRYSDCYSECPECGFVETSVNGSKSYLSGARDAHDDDCPQIHHWRAKHRLWERRKALLEKCYSRGVSPGHTSARLGYKRDSPSAVAMTLDVDMGECREQFRESMAHTAMAWLDTHSAQSIGQAFGYAGGEAVINAIEDYIGDVDFRAYELRRRGSQ